MVHIRDYDSAVTLIADADYITKGRLLTGDEHHREAQAEPGPSQGASTSSNNNPAAGSSSGAGGNTYTARHSTTPYSDDDRRKIEHGPSRASGFVLVCFLDTDAIVP